MHSSCDVRWQTIMNTELEKLSKLTLLVYFNVLFQHYPQGTVLMICAFDLLYAQGTSVSKPSLLNYCIALPRKLWKGLETSK